MRTRLRPQKQGLRVMLRALDEAPPRPSRRAFANVRRAELQYGRQLRKIARHVGEIIKGFPVGDPAALPVLEKALAGYSEVLRPWAETAAAAMVADVGRRDLKAWKKASADMSLALRIEIATAPTGQTFLALLAEQVAFITSLPIEAGRRVHELTIEGLANASRSGEIAKEILRSGDVTVSRANLIARTEVARTSSLLVQARAQHIGSPGYFWETSRDSDVRPSHKKMQGQFVRWDSPPTLDGLTGHAGALPNCRCWERPVIPDEV